MLATADSASILSLLATNPEDPTHCLEVDGLQHSFDGGCRFWLGQVASSILTKTLGKLPWFLLVEGLEA